MKVYIAGKITGDPGYRDKFAAAEIQLGWQGHTVLNPAELPPKKREPQLTKRQAERLLRAEILSRCTPLLALPYEMQNRIGREYMDYD